MKSSFDGLVVVLVVRILHIFMKIFDGAYLLLFLKNTSKNTFRKIFSGTEQQIEEEGKQCFTFIIDKVRLRIKIMS